MSRVLSSINYANIEMSRLKSLEGYSTIEYIQKRFVDYLVSILLLLITSPVMLYTVYRIKKESPGSVFFTQSRVGKDGKKFTCYKFRSMYINSRFNAYTQDNDSRIFPFGKMMRKARIDELPQLINVIKGDMHIVGPRAEWDILVNEYENIIPNYHMRHRVKPGITGLAQVKYPYGRNVYDAKQKLKYDIEYIRSWSIFAECKVLLQTVLVVLRKSGM
jgi:lipopolysaccharide/colanic/teichoic acid biosynthesis glycosyltransferase